MNERSGRSEKLSIEARLDRLVDGELSPDEYRALLADLDEEPGAWRQCALAFLETQALGQELGQMRRALDALPNEPVVSETLNAANSGWKKAQAVLAIAASFLVAFGLGLALPRIFDLRQEVVVGGNMNATSPLIATDSGNGEVAAADSVRYVGDVRLMVDGAAAGPEEAGRVPVYEVSQDATQFLQGEPPALGQDLLDLLGKIGYEVRHDQQYFPAPLDDGRQIIVPVEGYQLTPVSRRY